MDLNNIYYTQHKTPAFMPKMELGLQGNKRHGFLAMVVYLVL